MFPASHDLPERCQHQGRHAVHGTSRRGILIISSLVVSVLIALSSGSTQIRHNRGNAESERQPSHRHLKPRLRWTPNLLTVCDRSSTHGADRKQRHCQTQERREFRHRQEREETKSCGSARINGRWRTQYKAEGRH